MPVPAELVSIVGHDNIHILQFWDELTSEEKDEFSSQLRRIDVMKAKEAFDSSANVRAPSPTNLSPVDDSHHIVRNNIKEFNQRQLKEKGMKAIANGQVAVLVLAGGQATRLGCDKPKGTIELGLNLTENDSLLCLQAGKIMKLEHLAAELYPQLMPCIPWLVMTSRATEEDTEDHLDKVMVTHAMKGFKESSIRDVKESSKQIYLFSQDDIPAFDMDGKLVLSEKNRVATSPNGNGGVYSALYPLLDELSKKGVKYIHVYCVDNILVKVADPLMIGLAIEKNADCIAKAVKRENPNEKVGVICMNEGKPTVVEYSELGDLAQRCLPDGSLEYRAGNIANHLFTLDFLKSFVTKDFHLPFHRAHKKIPFVDKNGKIVKTAQPNGIKLEQFVFDTFEKSKNFYILEVNRNEEFSPLKNPDSVGTDCLSTCRRDIYNLHTSWLTCLGVEIEHKDKEEIKVAIKPSRSYDGEHLEEFVGNRIQNNFIIN